MKVIVPAIRFAGIMIFCFGLAVLFNFGGVADIVGGTEDGFHKIAGMVMAIFGIVEIIVTPRILESILAKNRK